MSDRTFIRLALCYAVIALAVVIGLNVELFRIHRDEAKNTKDFCDYLDQHIKIIRCVRPL